MKRNDDRVMRLDSEESYSRLCKKSDIAITRVSDIPTLPNTVSAEDARYTSQGWGHTDSTWVPVWNLDERKTPIYKSLLSR